MPTTAHVSRGYYILYTSNPLPYVLLMMSSTLAVILWGDIVFHIEGHGTKALEAAFPLSVWATAWTFVASLRWAAVIRQSIALNRIACWVAIFTWSATTYSLWLYRQVPLLVLMTTMVNVINLWELIRSKRDTL